MKLWEDIPEWKRISDDDLRTYPFRRQPAPSHERCHAGVPAGYAWYRCLNRRQPRQRVCGSHGGKPGPRMMKRREKLDRERERQARERQQNLQEASTETIEAVAAAVTAVKCSMDFAGIMF